MNEREQKALGDARYEAWRNGLNPDEVDLDAVREDVVAGFDHFDCAEREVARLMSRRAARETQGGDK